MESTEDVKVKRSKMANDDTIDKMTVMDHIVYDEYPSSVIKGDYFISAIKDINGMFIGKSKCIYSIGNCCYCCRCCTVS